MFVLSYVLPPVEGAAFGKSEVFDGIATKRQAIDRIVNMLEASGVHQDRAQRFGFEMERLGTGSFLALEDDGRAFCIDHEDRAPNACPCCGRLVKWGDHAFAGSDDAYCLGCFTWDRNTPQCLPENSCHTWAEIHYEVDGETVKGGKQGETWYATYRVPDIYADKDTTEDVAETYGAPRYERKES